MEARNLIGSCISGFPLLAHLVTFFLIYICVTFITPFPYVGVVASGVFSVIGFGFSVLTFVITYKYTVGLVITV